ncbi:hypothetical protein ASC93_23885 [Massilia sp. Root335]|nr:hypothetical protein ASC93_23885 [Massilia sp. Root335]
MLLEVTHFIVGSLNFSVVQFATSHWIDEVEKSASGRMTIAEASFVRSGEGFPALEMIEDSVAAMPLLNY